MRRSVAAARSVRLLLERRRVCERSLEVVGTAGRESPRHLDVDPIVAQLGCDLGRLGEAGLPGRRQHAADDEAVHAPERIGRRDVDHADLPVCSARDVPHRGAAEVARVGDASGLVAVVGEAAEGEDAVCARVLAGHERRPGGQGDGGHGRAEGAPAPTGHECLQVGQPSGVHPRLEESPRGAVEADDQDLRHEAFLTGSPRGFNTPT